MINIWESNDKQIKKEIIEKGIFTKKPTEKTLCEVLFEDINIITIPDLPKGQFNSDYLNGSRDKNIVIGDASSIIDLQIERILKTMSLKEKSFITISITVQHETNNYNIKINVYITMKKYKPYKPIYEWSVTEKYEKALEHKEKGAILFKEHRYLDAFYKFSKSCKLLITLEPFSNIESVDEELIKKIESLRLITYNNMAECHLHQTNYEYVILLCTKVLNRDENNIKALYRRSIAYGNERNWEKAFNDMKRITEIEPNNKYAKDKLHQYGEEVKKANQKMDNIMKKMFMAIKNEK